jgi:hypothetical protein
MPPAVVLLAGQAAQQHDLCFSRSGRNEMRALLITDIYSHKSGCGMLNFIEV